MEPFYKDKLGMALLIGGLAFGTAYIFALGFAIKWSFQNYGWLAAALAFAIFVVALQQIFSRLEARLRR